MDKELIIKGELVSEKPLLIMVHGRGATANNILSLADHLSVENFTLIAPQAQNHTWYPYSFMAPLQQNQPSLDNALGWLNEILKKAKNLGIENERIFFLGFSQGACLTLEFAARNAKKYGGIIAFTGGLIGNKITLENYNGNFHGTKIYIGTSDPDPHVPLGRVKETETVLKQMCAEVDVDVFPGMGHTIVQDEIDKAIRILNP